MRTRQGDETNLGYFPIALQEQVNTLMLPILALIGVAFAVGIDPYVKKPTKQVMLAIDGLVLTLILANCVSNTLQAAWSPAYRMLTTGLGVYAYLVRPVVIVLFIYVVWDSPKRRLFWLPIILNTGIYLTVFFKPWTFFISENDGRFIRGPMGYTAHFVSFGLLFALLVIALIQFKRLQGFERMIPLANVVIAALGPVLDSRCHAAGTITFTEIATVFCCMFFYTWLHLQFVREHERALVAEQRIQIMISQIQPHFLYNTLTTIQSLCLENPRKAANVTERFATYLRQNIDSLHEANLIPFRKELDHTLVYAQIEMARFPNIHLDYEIEDEHFVLPALTVQPLVENAIRHGIRGREKGQIDIITNLLPDCHEIIIRDNGQGFSAKDVQKKEGPHIGLQNVKERLQKLCGGTMSIESEIGKGTCVTIRIPLGKE